MIYQSKNSFSFCVSRGINMQSTTTSQEKKEKLIAIRQANTFPWIRDFSSLLLALIVMKGINHNMK